jgi:predicted RNA-binding protein with PUA-like domain
MAYWLFKTEPDVFSIEDLANAPEHTTRWDGIRNYQARNFLRDQVKKGDQVFIYHSQCKPPGIVGLAKVTMAAYPDPAQFDPENKYFDGNSKSQDPRWFAVDVKHHKTFEEPLTLPQIKQIPGLQQMVLLRQGRLSIQPVTEAEAKILLAALG